MWTLFNFQCLWLYFCCIQVCSFGSFSSVNQWTNLLYFWLICLFVLEIVWKTDHILGHIYVEILNILKCLQIFKHHCIPACHISTIYFSYPFYGELVYKWINKIWLYIASSYISSMTFLWDKWGWNLSEFRFGWS